MSMRDRYQQREVGAFEVMLEKAESGELQYAETRKLGTPVNPFFFDAPNVANAVSAFVHPVLGVAKPTGTFGVAELASTIDDDMSVRKAVALVKGIHYALNLSIVAGLVKVNEADQLDGAPLRYRLTGPGQELNPYKVQLVTEPNSEKLLGVGHVAATVGGTAIGAQIGQPHLFNEVLGGAAGTVAGFGLALGAAEYLNRLSFGRQAYQQALDW